MYLCCAAAHCTVEREAAKRVDGEKKEKKNSRKVLRSESFSVPLRHQSFTQKNKHHEVQFKINGNS